MNKSCSKCTKELSDSNFCRNRNAKDGLSAWCKECKKAYQRDWSFRNKESESERQKDWYEFNREKKKQQNRNWQKHNSHKMTAISAKRRASKIMASPKWLSEQQFEMIREFYKTAHELTEKTNVFHEVDHIIPLQGRSVCGLHVPWNLQILTKTENLSKGNSLCTQS